MRRRWWDADLVRWMEWDEFVAYRNGKLSKEELHKRARKRREGREPVEPPGGSEQSSLVGWSD